MKYRCKTTCWWKERLWEEGEEFVADDGESVPEHFEPETGVKPAKKNK